MNKHEAEREIARRADGGVIVEVGVGGGNGIRALWEGTTRGRRLRIYAVDPYEPYTDLNGAYYGPETEKKLWAMLEEDQRRAKDVVHLREDAVVAGEQWSGLPVAMLWIDLADPEEKIQRIVDAWLPHIVPGGYLGLVNVGYAYRGVGAQAVADALLEQPEWDYADIGGRDVVAVLRKALPRRAVVYIGHGQQYVDYAISSAHSVRKYMETADTVLFCHPGANTGAGWSRLYPDLKRTHQTWYADNVAFFGRAMEELQDYQELLWLDCDTLLAYRCDELWLLLQEYDFAFGHGGERDNNQSIYGAPAAFGTPMVGICLFRNDEKMRAFVQRWLALYEEHEAFYAENDQYPLRDLLWKNDMGIRYTVLPPEFACRSNFGCWAKGMVRVMHGGMPMFHKTMEQCGAELNSDHTMRLWHPRYGIMWSVKKEQAGRMG